MIIGLCGGSGSGKGTVCSVFSKHGIPSIDTDAVYRSMTSGPSPCMTELVSAFGNEILRSDGSLDRIKLANIVFASGAKEKKRLLESITHKHILSVTEGIIEDLISKGAEHVIVDAPLLFESGFDRKCDIIIAVIADRAIRISRIVKRDGISVQRAELRIDNQIGDDQLKGKSDYVIYNNGDVEELEVSVSEIIKIL